MQVYTSHLPIRPHKIPDTLELNAWRLPRRLARLEIRIVWLKSGDTRPDAVRKLADESVVFLHGLVVAASFNRDAVLRALQLVLQLQKVLIGFQIGIVF